MVDRNLCNGCSLCAAVCPVSAITFTLDEVGFFRPVINEESCIKCGACDKRCPMEHPSKPMGKLCESICYYCFNPNLNERAKSTSGGIFYKLAEEVLKKGGMVCGCIWDDTYETVHHECTDSLAVVQKMRGSKYVQSNLGNSFRDVENCLKSGRHVLFSGTGCQTDAIRQFTGNPNNLTTCSFVCGGLPSPKVWCLYKQAIEMRKCSKITNVLMRSKRTNWLIPEIELQFEDGSLLSESLLGQNLYGSNFALGLLQMESCMQCKFRGDNLNADIVLSDHWGLNPYFLKYSKNMGASAVIIRTDKGNDLYSHVSPSLYSEKGDINDIIRSHHVLTCDHTPNSKRKYFFTTLQAENVDVLRLLEECIPEREQWIIRRNNFLHSICLYIPLATLLWRLRQTRGKYHERHTGKGY